MNISDCAKSLTNELNFEVSTVRVRRYADMANVERKDNDYRDISEEDYATIKVITVLFELGISQDYIQDFINHVLVPSSFKDIVEKVHNTKSTLIPIAERVLSEFTFYKM